jgi:hypothetical protein
MEGRRCPHHHGQKRRRDAKPELGFFHKRKEARGGKICKNGRFIRGMSRMQKIRGEIRDMQRIKMGKSRLRKREALIGRAKEGVTKKGKVLWKGMIPGIVIRSIQIQKMGQLIQWVS